MIKLIASDLDGTLFNNDKEITPYTAEKISEAVKHGIWFVPSTGRPIGSVTENVLNLPGIRYIICSNGAAIYSLPEKKRIYEKILNVESVQAIRKIPRHESIAMEAFIQGVPYAEKKYVDDPAAFGATEYGVKYVQSTRNPVSDWEAFLAVHENEFDSLSFAGKNYEELTKMRASIVAQVPDTYAIWSFTHLLEVGHTEAGKGETLLQLLRMLGISREEAIAFGDAENDETMIQSVRYGIAMGNAMDELKEKAFAVTDSNEEDGVGKAIEKYIFSLSFS